MFIFAAIIALTIAFLSVGLKRPSNSVYDEGIVLYGALRVMNGEVIYKDFWTRNAPGQFFTVAALYRFFGATIMVERVWDVLVRFLISCAVYVAAAKVTSSRIAIVPWVAVTLWLASTDFYGYPAMPAILFSFLSALSLMQFISSRREVWLFIGGVFVGIAILFRHDIGSYILVGESAVLAVFSLRQRRDEMHHLSGIVLEILRIVALYAVGVLIAVLPMSLYLLSVAPIYELWSELVVDSIASIRYYVLPVPPLIPNPLPALTGVSSKLSYATYIVNQWTPFYLPFVIFGLTIFTLSRKIQIETHKYWAIILIMLLGLAFSVQAVRRADTIHFLPMHIPAVILLIFLLAQLYTARLKLALALSLALTILMTFNYFISEPLKKWFGDGATYPLMECFSKLERAGCVSVDSDQERAAQFIQASVPSGEAIFVGNSRHDLIYINDIMFYFLADRASATQYHQLDRDFVPTLAIQQKIVESLAVNRVKYVVLVSRWENVMEPNVSGESSGVRLLDDFIRENYLEIKDFGDWGIWKQN